MLDLLNKFARGDYIEAASHIIAVGSSGTGKAHIWEALYVAAFEQCPRVRRYKAIELVSEIGEAQEQHQLHRYLRRFTSFDLVVIEELGQPPEGTEGQAHAWLVEGHVRYAPPSPNREVSSADHAGGLRRGAGRQWRLHEVPAP
jgi:DNA replication protein DnaC